MGYIDLFREYFGHLQHMPRLVVVIYFSPCVVGQFQSNHQLG